MLITLGVDETAVAITVRDHGVGLKPGEEKLVFNRFWRADPSRARQTGGTGLGLSISLEDARLHGGWLEAWGAPGQGAQFRLTLPARAGDRLTTSPLRLVPADAALPFGGPRDGGPLAIGPGTGGRTGDRPGAGRGRTAGGGALVRRPTLLGAARRDGAAGRRLRHPGGIRRAGGRQGRRRDRGRRDQSGGSEPPTRTASGSDNEAFVRNFLSAAAGEPDRAYERVKAFIAPEDKTRLQDKKGSEVALNVVRLREAVYTLNSDSTTTVKITVQQIGVLRANGTLAPPVATETEYEFGAAQRVRSTAASTTTGPACYVIDPPNVLLLSDTALRRVLPGRDDLLLEFGPQPPGARPALPAAGGAGRAAGQRGGEVAGRRPLRLVAPGGRRAAGPHRADQQRHRRRTAGGRSTWTCPVTTRTGSIS